MAPGSPKPPRPGGGHHSFLAVVAEEEGLRCLVGDLDEADPSKPPHEAGPANGPCRCQNRRISGKGSRTMRLRLMVTRDWGHDVYPGSGPLYGGNTLLPA